MTVHFQEVDTRPLTSKRVPTASIETSQPVHFNQLKDVDIKLYQHAMLRRNTPIAQIWRKLTRLIRP